MEDDDRHADDWVDALRQHVVTRPIAVLRLSKDDLAMLLESRKGISDFTMAHRRDVFAGAQTPCVVLIFSVRPEDYLSKDRPRDVAYVGVLHSKTAATTLDTSIRVKRSVLIEPETERDLVGIIPTPRFARDLAERLESSSQLIRLSPGLSRVIIDALVNIEANRGPLRSVAAGLVRPKLGSNESLQFDAVEMAIKAFGLAADTPASELALARRAKSSLARARIMEDAAIEHDARVVPGYEFVDSSVTGRATFRRGLQTLEVFTANRRRLEEAFGVDLIYLNLFQRNVVMVQYKMLEPQREENERSDWVYREDGHLGKQLRTMNLFRSRIHGSEGYRLSAETFYFKFVRRRGPTGRTNVLLPLSHFAQLLQDSNFRTRTGAVKVAYSALDGRYMRQTAFFSLLQSGYIGSDATKSEHLRTLIQDVADGGDALVVAVQRETARAESEADRMRQLRRHAEDFQEGDE